MCAILVAYKCTNGKRIKTFSTSTARRALLQPCRASRTPLAAGILFLQLPIHTAAQALYNSWVVAFFFLQVLPIFASSHFRIFSARSGFHFYALLCAFTCHHSNFACWRASWASVGETFTIYSFTANSLFSSFSFALETPSRLRQTRKICKRARAPLKTSATYNKHSAPRFLTSRCTHCKVCTCSRSRLWLSRDRHTATATARPRLPLLPYLVGWAVSWRTFIASIVPLCRTCVFPSMVGTTCWHQPCAAYPLHCHFGPPHRSLSILRLPLCVFATHFQHGEFHYLL